MMACDCLRVDPLDMITNATGKVTLSFPGMQKCQATPNCNSTYIQLSDNTSIKSVRVPPLTNTLITYLAQPQPHVLRHLYMYMICYPTHQTWCMSFVVPLNYFTTAGTPKQTPRYDIMLLAPSKLLRWENPTQWVRPNYLTPESSQQQLSYQYQSFKHSTDPNFLFFSDRRHAGWH